jgi:MFS family permease
MSRPKFLSSPWSVLVGCLLALATSAGAVIAFTLSLFIAPLATEFQWSRMTISLGFAAMTLTLAVTAPFAGRVFDRFGVRKTLLVVIPLFALSIASFSMLPASIPVFVLLFGVAGVLGAFQSPIPYVKVVSEWFDDRRGLALGIMMTGIGLGGLILTQTARLLLEHQGWRPAFMGLGAVIFVIGFTAVLLLVREPQGVRTASGQRASTAHLPGATVSEALRDFRFWAILLFVFCLSMTVNGIAANAAPLLVSKDITASAAGSMLAALALSSLLGRLVTGFLLDRLFAPYVATAICLLALGGMGLLWMGGGTVPALLGLFCVGFTLGAETDAMSYMMSRYFGLRSFGELVGYMFGAFSLAPAVSMPLLGWSFDATQSYGTALAGFAVGVVIAILAIVRLGPYTYRAQAH